jgi:hypothetical protein
MRRHVFGKGDTAGLEPFSGVGVGAAALTAAANTGIDYKLMEGAAEATHDAIAFAKEVLRNEKAPIVLRFMAFDRLMNRAYGLPFQAVDISQMIQEQSAQKVIHEVRWLPPDPNDRSKVIEPEPD